MDGLDGPLVSHHAAAHLLWPAFRGRLGEDRRERAARRFRAWQRQTRAALGPASGLRAVLDVAVAPLASLLGFTAGDVVRDRDALFGELSAPAGAVRLGLAVAPWDASLPALWRPAVRDALARGVDWSIGCSGTRLRVIDVRRSHAARYLEIDLHAAGHDPALFAVLWGLCRADAFRGGDGGSLFDEAVELSARHGASVCRALHAGVRAALDSLAGALASRGRARRGPRTSTAGQSLTLIYRMLFLLFAEARRLVPLWHPVYRASYSMTALVEALGSDRPAVGLWSSVQAASRLAHRGCRFEDLVVTPFNGQLFAAARTPLGEAARVPDRVMRQVLLALATRQTPAGRERISYADLGVEELGAVYERVLDHACALDRATQADGVHVARSARKDTATFYTPRSLTGFLVRRTLAPLVADAPSGDILALKVVDPAMGSGAFLVAATRFLAEAYERALVREGRAGAGDITERDRAAFRRLIVQRCIYGVDLNPMAVELAKLSLWLATLAADAPLTFLDHHLRVGDSLLGASPSDAARRPAGAGRGPTRRPEAQLPLFEPETLEADLRVTLPAVRRLSLDEDTSPDVVARKERDLAALQSDAAPLARWRRVLDFWSAAFLAPAGPPLTPALARGIVGELLTGHASVPRDVIEAWRGQASDTARRARFFHWTLELPEVFADAEGRAGPQGGFDAVLGNPPWDVLRADTATERPAARARACALNRFVRHSGIYHSAGQAHVNAYQLFVERARQLVRPGGRIGLVLPWGVAADHGSTRVRRLLLERCRVDALVGFENRRGLFPIHRSTRFVLLSASAEDGTRELPCRLGLVDPGELDRIPDTGAGETAGWTPLSMALLRRVSGPGLSIPDARSPDDLRLLAHLSAQAPGLGNPDGWRARFGRELHATDDRAHLGPPGHGWPVIEGRQLQPFRVDLSAARSSLPSDGIGGMPGRFARMARARLAYRDVASATNRLSLIAAILPAGTASTHTVFTLEDPLDLDDQRFLCAVLNSYVANAYVRLFMSSHVTAGLIERLPVPRPPARSAHYASIVRLTGRLLDAPSDGDAHAALQAAVAHLYRLDEALFTHVLEGFPLVDEAARCAAMERFRASEGPW